MDRLGHLLLIERGTACAVYVGPSVDKELRRKVSLPDRRRAERIMGLLANAGLDSLHSDQLKPEGKYSDGVGGQVQVFALRGHQVRLYGGWVREREVATFAFLRCEIKKQDRANKALFEATARELGLL